MGRLLGHGHDAAKRNLGSVRAIRHEQIYSKNDPPSSYAPAPSAAGPAAAPAGRSQPPSMTADPTHRRLR